MREQIPTLYRSCGGGNFPFHLHNSKWLLQCSTLPVFVYMQGFCHFREYWGLRYIVDPRIKLTLQEVNVEVGERSKACRGEGDTWKKLQIYGGEGQTAIGTGLKPPAAACSPELKIPMSALKAVVDIECGFRMLDSDCVRS